MKVKHKEPDSLGISLCLQDIMWGGQKDVETASSTKVSFSSLLKSFEQGEEGPAGRKGQKGGPGLSVSAVFIEPLVLR